MMPSNGMYRVSQNLLSVIATLLLVSRSAAVEAPDFLREVRPILSSHCFKCHGPDDSARKGGLRLDVRDAAIKQAKSGELAVVPGKPDKSQLITRIFSKNPDELMPPSQVKHPLSEEQKSVLKRWIAAGAEYRPHWAFVAPHPSTPPSTAPHPIDAFVLSRLKKFGLKPSLEADRLTLARRLHLDLIGLPPTPEEADAFAIDPRPHAYELLVDRLLASPRYGERWARRWLDLARYADSNGYEKDRTRSVWPYRDWVIRALNADQPFDQFTIEQIAGDLLPHPNRDQLIATGFHRNTMLNEEGGIDPLEFRYLAVVDRVSTTATTWLGLTMGCAQCHTHKYDPILHQDYYSFMAFLNNSDEPELDLPGQEAEEEQRRREDRVAKLLTQLPSQWPVESAPLRWERVKLAVDTLPANEPAKPQEDGSLLFATPGPERTDLTVRFTSPLTNVTHLRLEALADDSLPNRGPGRTPHGNFVISEVVVLLIDAAGVNGGPVKIRTARASAEQEGFAVRNLIDGDENTGWAVHEAGKLLNQDQFAMLEFERPLNLHAGHILTVRIQQAFGTHHTVGRLGLSVGAPRSENESRSSLREASLAAAFTRWLDRERARTVNWIPLRPSVAKANLPLLTVLPDASVLASGDISKSDTYDLSFTQVPHAITGIRLEVLPDDSLPAHGPGLTYYEGPKGDFFLGEFQATANGQLVKFTGASHSYAKNNFGGGGSATAAIDADPQTGWSCAGRPGEAHNAVFIPAEPIKASALSVKMLFGRHYACSLGRFRISVTSDSRSVEAREMPEAMEKLLRISDAELSSEQRHQLRDQFLLTAPEMAKEAKEIRDLRSPPGYTTTLVMRERPANAQRPTFIHNRGEFLQPTTPVSAEVPHFLPRLPEGVSKDRLAMAKWLVSPENPLTARVVVNRQWATFFGTGIVATQSDFGFQGELPSHPDLLDWLAVEFMKQGWSLKKLHRLIVTSTTYRQSSHVTPELLARDPANRLLSRGPRVRLEAEIIRDTALASSGTLSPKMFGAPVRPAQPNGVTEVAYGSPGWDVSAGEDRYRRSLYTFQKRTAPFAMFSTFDAPSGEACVARRDVSNTPLQSLTLLNDIAFVEAAQQLGALTAAQPGDDAKKATFIFRRALTRPPTASERDKLISFAQTQRERLRHGELKAKDLIDAASADGEPAVWTLVARAVLNLDETITKN